MSKLMYGADPEVFSAYKKNGSLFVMPPVFFREELKHPFSENGRHPIFIKENGFKVHEDGVAFEVEVSPSSDWTEVFEVINSAYAALEKGVLSNYLDHCDGEVHILPTINYDVDFWSQAPDYIQGCNIFGCDRDYDAFNTEREAVVHDVRKHPYRYGGGHIHISGSPMFESEPILAIKCQAMTAGLAAIAYSDVPELEHLRTYLYGRPGKYRPQKYPNGEIGIEYRTPSNRWTGNKQLAQNIFQWVEVGVNDLLETQLGLELCNELESDVAQAIINSDQDLARQLLNRVAERI